VSLTEERKRRHIKDRVRRNMGIKRSLETNNYTVLKCMHVPY